MEDDKLTKEKCIIYVSCPVKESAYCRLNAYVYIKYELTTHT